MVHTVKNVGIFKRDPKVLAGTFREHIKQLEDAGSVFTANAFRHEIELPHGVKFIFKVINDYDDVFTVMGIPFVAIYSDVECVKTQRFLLTRIRQTP